MLRLGVLEGWRGGRPVGGGCFLYFRVGRSGCQKLMEDAATCWFVYELSTLVGCLRNLCGA